MRDKYHTGQDFEHISAARLWIRENTNTYQNKKILRKLFYSDWWKNQNGNFGIIADLVLNCIHDSKEAFCSMSRDTISRHTGVPEKTVEYNIQKMLGIGLLKYHTIPSKRNSKYKSKLLIFNTSFNPLAPKYISAKDTKKLTATKVTKSVQKLPENLINNLLQKDVVENGTFKLFADVPLEPKKNEKKKRRPKILFTIKQIESGLLAGLGKRDFFGLNPCFQSLSLLMGSHGFKFDVLPCDSRKRLQLNKYGLEYEKLDMTGKVMYLINHFEDNPKHGVMIRVPENHVMVDLDSKESFEIMLGNNYHGGLIFQSPRGGKILFKLPESYKIDFTYDSTEFHFAGRHDCILGHGYKILSLLAAETYSDKMLDGLEKKLPLPSKKLVDISTSQGKIPKGCRNDFLFRKGRSLKCKGTVNYSDLFEALCQINKDMFDSPLPIHEVDDLAKHCLKYKNQEGFDYKNSGF